MCDEFKMVVQDAFTISGRGTVVTGVIEKGSIRKNSTALHVKSDNTTQTIKICDIESMHRILDIASAGMDVGLLIEGLEKENVACGDLIINR